MSFSIYQSGSIVPESYSRRLDEKVLEQEMPYGYDTNPPPADTRNFDQAALESKKEYPRRGGRAV